MKLKDKKLKLGGVLGGSQIGEGLSNSLSALTENKLRDPGLGTNLRPFAGTDLAESDRFKSGGIITTKLVQSTELV